MAYEIINRNKDSQVMGIQVGKKKGEFLNNIIRTEDASLARDIRQRFGQDRKDGVGADVLVARVPDRSTGKTFSVEISFDEEGKRI